MSCKKNVIVQTGITNPQLGFDLAEGIYLSSGNTIFEIWRWEVLGPRWTCNWGDLDWVLACLIRCLLGMVRLFAPISSFDSFSQRLWSTDNWTDKSLGSFNGKLSSCFRSCHRSRTSLEISAPTLAYCFLEWALSLRLSQRGWIETKNLVGWYAEHT